MYTTTEKANGGIYNSRLSTFNTGGLTASVNYSPKAIHNHIAPFAGVAPVKYYRVIMVNRNGENVTAAEYEVNEDWQFISTEQQQAFKEELFALAMDEAAVSVVELTDEL